MVTLLFDFFKRYPIKYNNPYRVLRLGRIRDVGLEWTGFKVRYCKMVGWNGQVLNNQFNTKTGKLRGKLVHNFKISPKRSKKVKKK